MSYFGANGTMDKEKSSNGSSTLNINLQSTGFRLVKCSWFTLV